MDKEFEIVEQQLDEPTCWRLVARAGFGRVGFVRNGAVAVLPVNVTVSHRRVLFRTADHSSLATDGEGALVAFEADHTDPAAESGWSVLIRGRLRAVTDTAELGLLRGSSLRPWAPDARDRWMAVTPVEVTGRMIQRHRHLPPGVHVPYMAPD